MERTAEYIRKTKETDIKINLNIDGTGKAEIDTGIGFFDHMLEGFASDGNAADGEHGNATDEWHGHDEPDGQYGNAAAECQCAACTVPELLK